MKGLILKDLYAIKKQSKVLMILLMFYLVYSIMIENVSMLGSMMAVICAVMPVTTMSYDERCKWEKYALSMPVTRKMVVLSKYFLGIVLNLLSMLIIVPLGIFITSSTDGMKLKDSLLTILIIAAVSMLFLSFILPILFKFGVEKGRFLMMLIIFLPAAIVLLLSRLHVKMPEGISLRMLGYLLPLVVILVLLLSIVMSLRIYNNKEF
jgi:putative exporter of polyketide antibiotics